MKQPTFNKTMHMPDVIKNNYQYKCSEKAYKLNIYLFAQSSIWIRNDMYEILAIACTILVSFYGIIAFNSTLFFSIADKLIIA